jgi:hypothetical protein
VLASVLRTCRQQGQDAIDILADLMRVPDHIVAPLVIPLPGAG